MLSPRSQRLRAAASWRRRKLLQGEAALLKRFRLTVDGFREKFRTGKPANGEAATQYAARLSHYSGRWTELSETAQEYGALRDLPIKEAVTRACPYLKGRKAKTIEEML